MAMRTPSPRVRREALRVAAAEFGWDPSFLATLRHTTLPWTGRPNPPFEIRGAVPLVETIAWGARDRLSIAGQYAGHLVFLRAAAIAENTFDPGEWVAVRKRGGDCRLIRIHARSESIARSIDDLGLIRQCAGLLQIERFPCFDQPWAKADAAYAEIFARIAEGRGADHEWLRAAGWGSVLAPGPGLLRELVDRGGVRLLSDDPAAIDALSAYASMRPDFSLFLVGDESASPLVPGSGIASLTAVVNREDREEPGKLVESLLAALQGRKVVVAVRDAARLDRSSKRLMRMLMAAAANWSWVIGRSDEEWMDSAREVIQAQRAQLVFCSPKLEPLRALQSDLEELGNHSEKERWAVEFVQSSGFGKFVTEGLAPSSVRPRVLDEVTEPRRSYLAALALLGEAVDRDVAGRLLIELGSHLEPGDLAIKGVARLDASSFRFSSAVIRRSLAASIPAGSRSALCRLAASLLTAPGLEIDRAGLLLEGGDFDGARTIFETCAPWKQMSPATVVARLGAIPVELLRSAPELTRAYAGALLDAGQYRKALEASSLLEGKQRGLVAAMAQRRLGNYVLAREHLAGIPEPFRDFEVLLLEGELLRLSGEIEQARRTLTAAGEVCHGDEEQDRLAYESAVLCLEVPAEEIAPSEIRNPYLAARLRAYVALERRQYVEAAAEAGDALRAAKSLPQEIDASLDLLYTHFLAGDWERARLEARRALALTEETEGDRAAGGILFTYGYLAADAGSWNEAAEAIRRLRCFYDSVGDRRRESEIDLLAAQLFLGQGDFPAARRHAGKILEGRFSPEIREAAAIVLDEADWIEGSLPMVRSTGASRSVELCDRHLVNLSRTGLRAVGIAGTLSSALAAFEQRQLAGIDEALPPVHTDSEKLRLLHSLSGLAHRTGRDSLVSGMKLLSSDLGIAAPAQYAGHDSVREMALLRAASEREFPFAADAFGEIRWRFVSRNRLGDWNEIGSMTTASTGELERLLENAMADWVPCGDSSFLFIEGIASWPDESRRAIASLFRIRSEHHRLQRLIEQEEPPEGERVEALEGVVGNSPVLLEISEMVSRIARRDIPVCILGESGTGKELIARAIHRGSPRRARPFTAVNCAALPETLVESELFGHVRGAFTGADRDRAGLVETTEGGTLFLDEIGELPLPTQAKLLRVLQEGEFRRVGDSVNRHANLRIVAATNRKLERAVDEGRFREDLYYRVRGVEISVPPLRERGGDILLLARHFLAEERQRHRGGPDRLAPDTQALFLSYNWPGNVRELQNCIRGAHAVAGEARQIEIEHLPERMQGVLVVRTPTGTFYEEMARFRKGLVEKSLAGAGGNQNKAAKMLGMSRQALAYQIRELGILVRERPGRRRSQT